MPRLVISLLGPGQFRLDDAPVAAFPYDKVRALLARVAADAGHPQRREALAALLWPEQDERAARHSLSQAIWSLRRTLADDSASTLLLVTRDTVGLNPAADIAVDTVAVEALLDAVNAHQHPTGVLCRQCAGRIASVARHYRGPFLADLSVPDSAEFEDWAQARRERIAALVTRAFGQLVAYYQSRGEHSHAAEIAQRLIQIDPCDESAHRQLMVALAAGGKRAAALTQYEHCRRALADELGIEPDEETTRLYERIRDKPTALPISDPHRTVSSLPLDVTPFIGRDSELQQIATLIDDPSCRHITLVGPGGIGKTRLAIRAAEQSASAFRDGAHFVALASVEAAAHIPTSIADALDLHLTRAPSPAEQVIRHLREREALLVLDNVEQLLPDVTFLADILSRAPDIQLIVTTRERLHLRGEWVVELDGLALPDRVASAAQSSAVQLFAHSARRVWPAFELDSATLADVIRICRLTGGMPLGIELAAAWLPTLSCAEIASEIERSLDFLSSPTRVIPERHRSIRVVFDRSWERLSAAEQQVFARLAIFHGGIPRAAAEAVAGGSLPLLAALVAKSLLRRDPAGRYYVHELLRQYAADRVAEQPDAAEEARDRHCAWFCDLLLRAEADLSGAGQQIALESIGNESENIRAAWLWAIERRRVSDILKAIHGYWLYAEVTGRYLEAQEIFGQVIAMLAAELDNPGADRREWELAYGATLIRHGSLYVRLGDYATGKRTIDAGIEVLEPLNDPFNLGLAFNFKAMFAQEGQDYEQASALLRESIAHFIAAGDRWGQGYSLNDQGTAALMLGNADEARRLHHQALTIFAEIGDRRGSGFALHNLGVVALATGDLGEARTRLSEALLIRRGLRHTWGVAVTLALLGRVLSAASQPDAARDHLREALALAIDARSIPVALGAAIEIAALHLSGGECERDRDRAARTLMLARSHPALDTVARARADGLLAGLNTDSPAPPLAPDWTMQPVAEQVRILLGDAVALARV